MKNKNIIFSILSIIFFILLSISLFRNLTGFNYGMTFSGFLNFIQGAPSILPNFTISNFSITSSWGILNGLRDFFNLFIQLFGLLIWFAKNAISCLIYIFYFLRYLFAI